MRCLTARFCWHQPTTISCSTPLSGGASAFASHAHPDAAMREQLWSQFLGSYAPKDLRKTILVARSNGVSGAVIEQVSLDAKRSAVLTGLSQVDEDERFGRLGLAMALMESVPLSTRQAEINWLRRWDQKIFSLRTMTNSSSEGPAASSWLLKTDASAWLSWHPPWGGRAGGVGWLFERHDHGPRQRFRPQRHSMVRPGSMRPASRSHIKGMVNLRCV